LLPRATTAMSIRVISSGVIVTESNSSDRRFGDITEKLL
jgi:hypothetical protein